MGPLKHKCLHALSCWVSLLPGTLASDTLLDTGSRLRTHSSEPQTQLEKQQHCIDDGIFQSNVSTVCLHRNQQTPTRKPFCIHARSVLHRTVLHMALYPAVRLLSLRSCTKSFLMGHSEILPAFSTIRNKMQSYKYVFKIHNLECQDLAGEPLFLSGVLGQGHWGGHWGVCWAGTRLPLFPAAVYEACASGRCAAGARTGPPQGPPPPPGGGRPQSRWQWMGSWAWNERETWESEVC